MKVIKDLKKLFDFKGGKLSPIKKKGVKK